MIAVSRETWNALDLFEHRLAHWNLSINLVGQGDTAVLRQRHTMDSLHVLSVCRREWTRWIDLGSGGGFPGLVIAIACRDDYTKTLILVESDRRKAAFLQIVANELGLRAEVVADRIEAIASLDGDVISARALAPLPSLLGYVLRHGKDDCEALFPKGRRVDREIEDARMVFDFEMERLPGAEGSDGTTLRITNVHPRNGLRG